MDRTNFARLVGETRAGSGAQAKSIVIAEGEPGRFMRAFAAAAGSRADVFLADPGWGAAQHRVMAALTATVAAGGGPGSRGWLMIPSGGTSGGLKFARHDEQTIGAAVRGFCAHFALNRVNAVGVLPLYHVSGFMAWMRCALTGGEYVTAEWRKLEQGETPAAPQGGDWVISLVPTQLQRLLGVPTAVEWLRRFRAIFLGGGPAWLPLLEEAATLRLPLAPSYGMTETAAMIAAVRPAEFLGGDRTCGTMMPHGRVTIGENGIVRVAGESLFRGYFPDWREPGEFVTEDLGAIDAQGRLTILGRRDAMIITGGKKVHPAEVETALRGSGEFKDVVVLGVPDAEWGEVVVACYPAGQPPPDFSRATRDLASHQRPKRFVAIREWPRNAQGKVNRAELLGCVLRMD